MGQRGQQVFRLSRFEPHHRRKPACFHLQFLIPGEISCTFQADGTD
jgi:hypothetical protein